MAALADPIAGLNGTWTWFNNPRAVYSSVTGKLFYAFVRSTGVISVASLDYNNRIFQYGTPRTAVLQVDDHVNPAIIVLDNGEVLVAYSVHNGDGFSARSANAYDIRTWDAPVQVNSGSDDDTYASLMQMGDTAGTCYWFFRRGNPNGPFNFRTSTDRGDTWASSTEFFRNGSERPYLIAEKTASNRVDFVSTQGHPNEVTGCSIYHWYMEVAANGTRSYYKSDGTLIGGDAVLPLEPADVTLVYSGATSESWNWDLAMFNGNPVITYATFTDSNEVHHYHQARWSGSAWESDEITTAGTTPNYLYASEVYYSPGVCLDPNDINSVYVSVKYGAGDFRIEKWSHTGSFPNGTWAKVADTSGNTATVNARPFCPRGSSPGDVLWWEGTYTSFTNYFTRIRVSPSFPWRKAKPVTPSWTASLAPPGIQAYYLINEGSGTSLDDLANNRDGTFVGTPAWNVGDSGDFGPYLNGFDTSNYVQINALAAALSAQVTNYPIWIAVLYKTTSTGTTAQNLVGIGNSGTNNPLFQALSNNGGQTVMAGQWRDTAGATSTPSAASAGSNDGEFHVLTVSKTALAAANRTVDGVVASSSITTGAVTFDRGAIGCLLRAAASGAFAGEIHAALVGWGAEPDAYGLALDLLRGQFLGTYNALVQSGGAADGDETDFLLLDSRRRK